MKKLLLIAALVPLAGAASAQFQVNPQLGLTYQHLTDDDPNVEFRGTVGWQVCTDLRIGNRAYFQPGVFFGRNVTAVKTTLNDSVLAEGDIIRTNLRLKLLGGYRIVDSYQFDLRFFAGPTYDVLLSVDDRDDHIGWNKGDFNNGSFNVDAGLERDNPNVLVCVHGLTRNGRDFDNLARVLAADYRVLCPDVVGRGRSDWLR